MPAVTATPIQMSNGDIITQFADTVGTSPVTYSYAKTQDKINISNTGSQPLSVTVAGVTQVITTGHSWFYVVDFAAFTINAVSGTTNFDVSTDKKGAAYSISSGGGSSGAIGPQGVQGLQGPKGDKGDKGNGGNGGIGINVKDFGAVGDGVANDTAAFISAMNAIKAAIATNPAAAIIDDANKRGRVKLIIPEGCYIITAKEALMLNNMTTIAAGYHIQGAGKHLTQIYYKNTSSSNEPLLFNNDSWMGVTISDIEFTSSNISNIFMRSFASGGAQNYSFERCAWNGLWTNILLLEGDNINSEMSWYHCNFNTTIQKAIYAPNTTGSDQFVNYNFFACNFEVSDGTFLHFEKGGSINIWGGSFIHYGSSGGTFFVLGNNTHAFGTQRFLCVGARFEHRNTNSKLIDCRWNDGVVSFINCDTSSQVFAVSSFVAATFRSGNQKMCNIKFDNCSLMGKHEYVYDIGSWSFPHNVLYESCEFTQANTAADFIVYTNLVGFNDGGTPIIKFQNCRSISGDNTNSLFDCNLGFKDSTRGELTRKIVSIKTADGDLPINGATEEVYLPLNAIITAIHFYWEQGATGGSSSTWTLNLKTSETTPTVIASIAGIDKGTLSAGFNDRYEKFFICDSDVKRHIKLVSNASGETAATSRSFCLVEYLC